MIKISIKHETADNDFTEYESEDLASWDDAEAFLASTRRVVERAVAAQEAIIPEDEDESLCGKPENHDGGSAEGCAECGAIKLNI